MKLFIALLLTTSSVWSRSVVPSRTLLNPLNLYHKNNKVLENGNVEVKAVEFSRSGSFLYNKKSVQVTKEKYDEYHSVANAVLRMVSDEWSGTGFHIGSNLILTNNHVLDPTFANTTHCGNFRLTDYQNNKYDCKEVHYCNAEHDVCLIEMETTHKRVDGERKIISLAEGPSLKLKLNSRLETINPNEEVTTAIGNSGGQGTHYSQGRGISFTHNRTYFYAPIIQGNSGGPLLNSKNQVIGVVKLQSKTLISEDIKQTYNIALPTDYTVNLIRQALEKNPQILRKFNEAVIE